MKKETDSGYQWISAPSPVLFSFIHSEEPRYPHLRGIMDAFDRNIEIFSNADLELDEKRIGLDGSPTKVKKVFKPAPKGKGVMIEEGTPRDMVNGVVDFIREKNIIR